MILINDPFKKPTKEIKFADRVKNRARALATRCKEKLSRSVAVPNMADSTCIIISYDSAIIKQ